MVHLGYPRAEFLRHWSYYCAGGDDSPKASYAVDQCQISYPLCQQVACWHVLQARRIRRSKLNQANNTASCTPTVIRSCFVNHRRKPSMSQLWENVPKQIHAQLDRDPEKGPSTICKLMWKYLGSSHAEIMHLGTGNGFAKGVLADDLNILLSWAFSWQLSRVLQGRHITFLQLS